MEMSTEDKVPYDPKKLSESDLLLFYGSSRLNNPQAISLTSKQGLYPLHFDRKKTDEEYQLSKPKTCWDKFVINPKSTYKIYFDNFVLMLVIYSTITTAYYVAFEEDAVGL